MKQHIESLIKAIGQDLFHLALEVNLTRPDSQFGHYSTNVALQVSKVINKSPIETANLIAQSLNNSAIEKVEVVKPGFINITLSDQYIADHLSAGSTTSGKKEQSEILVEFGDPNPFKEMHIGHVYSAIVGDTIASLFEYLGHKTYRLSYHGDVGLHVAKWIWGVRSEFKDNELAQITVNNKYSLGYFYALGAKAYDDDPEAASEIKKINKAIYEHDDATINEVYELGKKLSFQQFEAIFKDIGVTYDKRYLESESVKVGTEVVKQYLDKVFIKSEGAYIFPGESKGLHNRVFITSQELPTYETKDLGLAIMKDKDYPDAGKSIVITAVEQAEYFKVMLAALSEINPGIAQKTIHLAHGFLGLNTGKMSSRKGDVYTAESLIAAVKSSVAKKFPESKVQEEVYLAALRYTFLKQRLGPDMVFNVEQSVSIEGNSGPYIQYAYARAKSIIAKLPKLKKPSSIAFDPAERALAYKITGYDEVLVRASEEFMPHHICNYLYELAQTFNSFYENNRVLDNDRMEIRHFLVDSYANILKHGLGVLHIPAPDRM